MSSIKLICATTKGAFLISALKSVSPNIFSSAQISNNNNPHRGRWVK